MGITLGALPAIFLVNYRLVDGAIGFRTAPGSKMSAAVAGAVVAVEVDDHGVWDRSGRSVLAVGEAHVVDDLALHRAATEAGLERLADGARTAMVRVEPAFVSGRLLVRAPTM